MSDTERDSFYLGALLHDIGKFIQRAEIDEWKERADEYVKSGDASKGDYTHKRYSAAFIKKFRNKTGIFPQDAAAESYALWHHRGKDRSKFDNESINKKGVPLKLIHIADISASEERQTDAEIDSQDYNLAKLESIFCNVALRNSDEQLNSFPEKRYINLGTLTCKYESAFPLSKEPAYHEQNYTTLVNEFLAGFEKSIGKTKELQPFLVKYLHAVPAQTPFKKKDHQEPYRPDINLFDHSRVTAAIALCLYDEWIQGDWRGKDKQILDDTENGYKSSGFSAPCLLVSGDISGIQDFIFNVPSKGAAKTLKARSFFVQMLADVCVQKIQDTLDLKPANLLYNGGGQFYFLVPKCRAQDLNDCKEDIARALIDEELFLSIASVEVKVFDFMNNFGKKWKGVNDKLSIEKLRKFKGQKRKDVFGPFKQVIRENNERDPFFEITDKKFRKNDYYRILAESSGVKVPEEEEKKSWVDILGKLGYRFEFQVMGSTDAVAFNTTDFEEKCAGFRFSVKDLPHWRTVASIEQFKQDVENCGRSVEEYYDKDKDGKRWGLKPDNIITYSQLA
ncbi:MAG: type III-A CRISPR-associated protein Cas10/Csm1, partial [Chlorobium phaeobacteroides]|nr:type III-A CRISPR-associated protein Cas10/Csm1 [Chlorobium phaeobacteroides]